MVEFYYIYMPLILLIAVVLRVHILHATTMYHEPIEDHSGQHGQALAES